MKRPLLALAIIVLLFVGWIGSAWLSQPPSNQELLANYSKVTDYVAGMKSVGGFPWWTPSYLEGASLACSFAAAFTNLALFTASSLGGMFAGPKIAALLMLAACPFTMFVFVRRLTGNGLAGCAAGVLYLLSPSLLLRTGFVEHISIVSALAFIPLLFWSVMAFLEEPSDMRALVCAVCAALLTLSYAKIAILVLPLLLAFALWVWICRAQLRLPHVRSIVICLGAYVLLAVVMNLPLVRENSFITKFDLSPFAGWQNGFSVHSAISWMDRDGVLTGGDPGSHGNRDGTYLGAATALILLITWLFRRTFLSVSAESDACRVFTGLGLLALWFSFGPNSAVGGQLAFLTTARDAPHPGIAISWFLLGAQAWLVCQVVPAGLPWRKWICTILVFIYLLVPGFRLLEHIPLYSDIRAPHDIFHTGGIFCACVAAGCAVILIFRKIRPGIWKLVALPALAAIVIVDLPLTTRDFRQSPMDKATFPDFLAAQKFLSSARVPGRVLPLSGRYFYLLTPLLSGRSLVTEAFNSYYMLKGADMLQKVAFDSPGTLRPYLNYAGIAYVLLDKLDSDTPQTIQTQYRTLLPVVYENAHFAVLENRSSLAPAYMARDYAIGEPPSLNGTFTAAELAASSIATVENAPADLAGQKAAGRMKENSVEFSNGEKTPDGTRFQTVRELVPRRQNYQRIEVAGGASGGWLIVPEAWHPDWSATADGKPVPVRRAINAFLCAQLEAPAKDVVFQFRPPAWYGLCAWTGVFSWAVVIAFAALFPFLPRRWRDTLCSTPPPDYLPGTRSVARPAVTRPLVVLPTYNEATSISDVLDLATAALPALHLLVVDDGSPDGTAEIVQAHPEYGHRIHLLQRSGKLGLGSAYREGFRWAMERDYDAVVEMDGDLSHDPADIPRLLDALNAGADVAIGSRYLNGVRVINWPEERLILSSFASKYVRYLTRIPLVDTTSGFKAIRTAVLREVDWKDVHAEGYGFQIELHFSLWRSGWNLVEVPIVFTERRNGSSKMTRTIAIEAALRVLQLAVKRKFFQPRNEGRPLR